MKDKKSWLDHLYYKVNKQRDFDLTHLDKDGKNHKWRKYSELCFDTGNKEMQWFLEKVNQRQILPCEVILDLEEPERYNDIIKQLEEEGMFYAAYSTGSRGHHFQLLFDTDLTSEEKTEIIKRYNCDEQKASERCMIQLENELHWKGTGKKKTLVKENKGINHFEIDATAEEEAEEIEPEMFFTRYTEGKNEGQIKTFVPKRLGDFIMEKHFFKTIKGNDKQIYYYSKGYYKENGIALIRSLATSLLDFLFKEHHISETIAYIRNSTYIDADEINHNWINLKNGLLNPLAKEFKDHTPEIFCLKQLPIEYDPNVDCPFFKQKLKEKCDKNWKFELIQEMFGYCFLPDNRFEKAFLFYGDPRTMKSTTLYVLEKLLGTENIQSMSLQQLVNDNFAPAWLFGVPANICADLSSKELRNTAMFMKIIGQDSITAGKKFEHQITFTPGTKLIFSCNVIPGTTNKNMAFYRRWCIMEFNIQTKEDEVDILMRKKLLQELPGILNWSLDGLDRILKNNKLSYPISDADVKDLYEKGSDSIQSFIYQQIDCEDDEGVEKKREVYKRYVEYCKKNKLNVENHVKFGRVFFAVTGCGSSRVGTIPGYSGISLKNKQKPQKSLEND